MTYSKTIVRGLGFPEAPRWHDGRLWYIDIPRHELRAVDLDGRDELVEAFEHRPATIGFLPDGSPLVAFAQTKQIVNAKSNSVFCDLGRIENNGVQFAKFGDMVVDDSGQLYIGCSMPRTQVGQSPWNYSDIIVQVTHGEARVVETGCSAPNGMCILPRTRKLVLAESLLHRLSAWTIAADGTLSNRTVYSELEDHVPDGICSDSESAIWVAGLLSRQTARVSTSGKIIKTIDATDGRMPTATALGGPEGRHLFVTACKTASGSLNSWDDVLTAEGFVEVIELDSPRLDSPSP